ncbi:MAG: 2TM domain-containing protein [Pricia sp.]|nr:2TM domain-containing protein [Pricia sp.]
METNRRDKKYRARRKVEKLKGFYIHFTVFILVNLFILIATVFARMKSGESFTEAFFSFATFITPFFWGIGLAFHAANVFSLNPFFNKDWEERQIQKYMEEDKKEADKYR